MEWTGVNAGAAIRTILEAKLSTISLWAVGICSGLLIVSWAMSVFLFERKHV
jgi:hypothetical protein